jgi:hypothetical protein
MVTKIVTHQRYGKSRLIRKDRILAISIASITLFAFLLWAAIFTISDTTRVSHRDIAYEVVDRFSTNVTFEVSRTPGQIVVCDVTVLNQAFAIVGFLAVDVAASENRSTVISTTVRTTELGVSGLVDGCR